MISTMVQTMISWAKRRTLHIDLETYSSIDLAKSGLYKYVDSPDFEILLLAYAWDDDQVQVLDLTGEPPAELDSVIAAIENPDITKVAHNCAFERTCLRKYLGCSLLVNEWQDTMILAAMNGLPQSLDAAGAALQLQDQKLKEGTSLISYFCKPCKPTISNGGRTRNLPCHAPEKWERFKTYCARDVEVEREIYRRLSVVAAYVPDWERRVFELDSRINDRGVLIDLDFVNAAMAVDRAFNDKHFAEMQQLTGLDNPGSVAQLKLWLESVGVSCDSLNKQTVADLIERTTDPTIRRVLELRQQLGKTSIKKYETMRAAACHDWRVRGIMQYYGAGRTGRWAGRIVQPQNLPQNHLEQIDIVRGIVRDRDLDTLETLYDNVPDTLSQLIRTALIAKPGHTFLVADYSAIEARVISYLAGEQWRMDVFANGGDIYCSSASAMFHVPVEKHGINGHLRQKGKIAELACIAEGQLVLTDFGLVPIEKITKNMKVWDGVEWVIHDGVVARGVKEVLTYGGLEATADHIVWAEVDGQTGPLRFGDAAACGAHIIQTGAGGYPIRVGGNNQPRKTLERQLESLLRFDKMQRLRVNAVATSGQPEKRKIQRLPKLFTTKSSANVAGSTIYSSQATLHKPARRELQKLRRPGNRIPVSKRYRCVFVYDRNPGPAVERHGAGSHRREWALRTREPALGDAPGKLCEPATVHKKMRVYDIVNAGPRHRFTVSGLLVHNCGYGGGVGALKAFGADKMGLTDDEMQSIVAQWRAASPSIHQFWRETEKAVKHALRTPGRAFTVQPCGVKYIRDRMALRCVLPSGRQLAYWAAHLDADGSIRFMGQNQTTRKWEQMETWGGKLVENIVQAFARDCLAVAMLRLDAAGFNIVFHVHDEVIVEAPEGSRWEDVADIMGQPIDWAPGLLLRGDGYETKFYRKD